MLPLITGTLAILWATYNASLHRKRQPPPFHQFPRDPLLAAVIGYTGGVALLAFGIWTLRTPLF